MSSIISSITPADLDTKKPEWMKHSIVAASELETLLLPETSLEKALIQSPEFQEGLMWGTPRFGHPEGKVALHVREVLENVDRLNLDDKSRIQLRLIALAHDTFKFREPKTRPRDWTQHHATLARQFMEAYTDDKVVLTILELHDEAFYIWRRLFLRKQEEMGRVQLSKLLVNLGDMLDLFYLFFLCDTKTGDKIQAPVYWFHEVYLNAKTNRNHLNQK